MKKIIIALMAVMITVGLVGIGTYAIFSDTETSTDNTFTAGTLDLKVDDQDDPNVMHITLNNMKPGDSITYKWCLKNTGSIPGVPTVEFSAITNNENGTNEPEDAAEAQPYASTGGELGQYLKTSIGYAPCSWSVISKHIGGGWQTGPAHPWGVPGLNGLGGNTYGGFPVLGQNETIGFFLVIQLENDLRAWSGTSWYDVNDNIIQSDSVEFDIIFHLDQS